MVKVPTYTINDPYIKQNYPVIHRVFTEALEDTVGLTKHSPMREGSIPSASFLRGLEKTNPQLAERYRQKFAKSAN